MLIDSDVFIWLARGNAQAEIQLAKISPWQLSTVTYIEMAQGCRNKQELMRMKQGLTLAKASILPLNNSISKQAMLLIEEFALSHGLRLADALIAATAIEHGLTLLTGNVKHFAIIPNLNVEYFDVRVIQ